MTGRWKRICGRRRGSRRRCPGGTTSRCSSCDSKLADVVAGRYLPRSAPRSAWRVAPVRYSDPPRGARHGRNSVTKTRPVPATLSETTLGVDMIIDGDLLLSKVDYRRWNTDPGRANARGVAAVANSKACRYHRCGRVVDRFATAPAFLTPSSMKPEFQDSVLKPPRTCGLIDNTETSGTPRTT